VPLSREDKLSARVAVLSEALADALVERSLILEAARKYKEAIDYKTTDLDDEELVDQGDAILRELGLL
jgi:hypothetical protein